MKLPPAQHLSSVQHELTAGTGSGCRRQGGSQHTSGLRNCPLLSLLAWCWGATVHPVGLQSSGRPWVPADGRGRPSPTEGRGADGDVRRGAGLLGSPPARLGLSREPSRCCFHSVKKQHMSPVPQCAAAGCDARVSPDARKAEQDPRCQRCPACPLALRGTLPEPLLGMLLKGLAGSRS